MFSNVQIKFFLDEWWMYDEYMMNECWMYDEWFYMDEIHLYIKSMVVKSSNCEDASPSLMPIHATFDFQIDYFE